MAKFSRLKTKKSPSQWKWKRNVKGLRETGNSFLWRINLSCTRLIRFLVQENKSVIWTIVLEFRTVLYQEILKPGTRSNLIWIGGGHNVATS